MQHAKQLWECRSVFRSVAGKRGIVAECRHASLATKCFLDVTGPELFDVDDRAISVDVF